MSPKKSLHSPAPAQDPPDDSQVGAGVGAQHCEVKLSGVYLLVADWLIADSEELSIEPRSVDFEDGDRIYPEEDAAPTELSML